MKIIKNNYGEYEIEDYADNYLETKQAQPSSRLLEGSRDHGYDQEYIGYGEIIDGIPVIAVYLLSEDDYNADAEGEPDEDAGGWDWDTALSNGRLLINIDKLSEDAYSLLRLSLG